VEDVIARDSHSKASTAVSLACRTEFIVEKLLTNWLSLCMYGYVKKQVARAMFMLFKAIKHQTEKGPVDAVTYDARYALSEDRLLRENTDYRPLVKRLLLCKITLRLKIKLYVCFRFGCLA